MGQFAARVGDPHTCPLLAPSPHVGGPLLPPGSLTILIGGQSAVRLGDSAQCSCAVDKIAGGEASVLFEGLPAARMGDSTVHGGIISKGFEAVQIGSTVATSPTKLVESCFLCRQRLANAAKQSSNPNVQKAGQEMERLNHDLEHAKLADHVYEPRKEGQYVPPPLGWREVTDPAELKAMGLNPSDLSQPGSDFRARVYVPDPKVFGDTMKPTIAFKGTDLLSGEDWKNNLQQGLNMHSDYYENAVGIGKAVGDKGADVEYAGHSLGGGLASAASQASGADATTFNASGLRSETVPRYGGTPMHSNINAYQVDGEVLTGVQENSWESVAVAAAIGARFGGRKGAGILVTAQVVAAAVMADSVGTRYELPGEGDPLSRHSMAQVLSGLEKQIEECEHVLERATGIHCDC